ncbi:MAG: heme NO-binding domain-containing protein [Pseudomonadota bacterium]
MKGIVFNMLNEMVEAQYGMDLWDDLIDATDPKSEGIYTSVELYPDEELLAYVDAFSDRTGIPAADAVRAFGHFMLQRFSQIHPEFFEGHTIKSFLKSVHDVIHVEVEKLHPDALLPKFTYEEPAHNGLVMHYHSPRRLCHLAEGLINGCSEHFGVGVTIAHDQCMHEGAETCRLELSFSN